MPLSVRSKRGVGAPGLKVGSEALPFGLPVPPGDWVQKAAGISVCMIVKNEEKFLAKCLESLKGVVDEINVVDTGSTDRTIEIARAFGANVREHAWRNDFAWARNKSLEMASRRWILHMDADEELLPESFDALRAIAQAPAYLTGVWLRCVNSSDRYKGGGTVSHAIIRIFPNHERVRFRGAIHEFPSVDDSMLAMQAVVAPVRILHHGYLSDVVSDRGKYERNMAIVEQSIRDHPEDAFHWYNYGQTAHLNGENERAAPAFEKMWELCLKHGMRAFAANGLQMLADVYSEHLNKPDKGLKWALECLKHAPRYANAHFSAGKAYYLLGRHDEAREMYCMAIDDAAHIDRQFVVDDEVPVWKAQCEIGSSYASEGKHTAALEWFDKGLANRPKIQPLRVNRAKALEQLGRLDEAEEAFRSLYDDFRDEHSTVDVVNFYLRAHRDREALSIIDASNDALTPVALASMYMAGAYVVQKNGWGDGRGYIDGALAAEPQNEQALKARAALEQNGFARALELARSGNKDGALAQLAIVPDDVHAANAWLLKATLLRDIGRAGEAFAALENVVRLQPENLDAMLMRAQIAESAGNAGIAEAELMRALPVARARVSVELAGLYLRTGRIADAKRVAEEALT